MLSLSGLPHDTIRAARGKEKFRRPASPATAPDGKGNPALGAPNLTDKIWLYGGSEADIIETITNGRNGQMPAHKDFLGEAKVAPAGRLRLERSSHAGEATKRPA